MSNVHKNPTISFRISELERQEIEARIKASGMLKKDYFVRSCIYNRICVVGKKETIYPLVEELQRMYEMVLGLSKKISEKMVDAKSLDEMQITYCNMLKAIIELLDGAKYLWEGKEEKQEVVYGREDRT